MRARLHANQRDASHIAFHLGVAIEHMTLWTDRDGGPVASLAAPATIVVMRSDDNGNEVEVTRVTSRCEAAALVRDYEARGHKQLYWIADASTRDHK